ncbi:MAG: SPOR domain-containing protein [Armatimonadetes bacterium]|nr:SPOR domain-containing protein [Armatimonadota bacterium]
MAEASRGPGRFEYEDDAGSSQGLWILALVVAAVVFSFLFGRYVIGEKLKGSSSPAPVVAPASALGQPAGTTANSPVSITSSDAAAAGGTAAGALDAGMTNAASSTDPLAAGTVTGTGVVTGEPPKPATTTTTTANADSGKSKGGDKSTGSSSKSLNGGYDKAQPNKPFKPSTTASKSTSTKPTTKTGDSGDSLWRVQAGSYSSKDAAEKQRRDLTAKGHQSSVREAEVKGKTVYRVVVSTHHDESRANDVAKKLEKDGFDVSVEH